MIIVNCNGVMRERMAGHEQRLAGYYIPEKLWFKKVVVNVECYNEESFKWAITRSLNPIDKDPQWITADFRHQVEKYNWDGISFPTPLSEIETFERDNDILVNVFKWDELNERAYPIRIPNGKHNPRALLILIDEGKGHYVAIKSMQRLFRRQTGMVGKKMFYCNNCLTFFSSDDLLQKHIACCDSLGYASFERGMGMTPMPKSRPRPRPRLNAGRVNLRAAIDMKCSDNETFKWAVVRSLNPVDRNSGRVTKILREQSEKYNWDGVLSHMELLDQVEAFERSNDVLVNVFRFSRDSDRVRLMSVSMGKHKERALILRVDGRCMVVKEISRLLGRQAAKGKRRCERFYCSNCLENFTSELQYDVHIADFCKLLFAPRRRREHVWDGISLRNFSDSEGEDDDSCLFSRAFPNSGREGNNFCSSFRTFSDDEQEDDFNEYMNRKINDDS